MKKKLKALIKKSKVLYSLYFYIGSVLLKFLGIFIKTDPYLILFVSYGGQKYDDSPRVLYEFLCHHPMSESYKYIWAFIEPDNFPQIHNKIKIDSISYYITAMRAAYWITNSSASRGLNFQKKQTKNYLFQHGMAGIKKIGNDIHQGDKVFKIKFHEHFDGIFIEGNEEIPILMKAWDMNESIFHVTGLPRNDDLWPTSKDEIDSIKNYLKIPSNKKVILYAPTFREFSRQKDGTNVLGIPINFSKWKATLGQEYVLLVTAHYEVAKLINEIPANDFVINVFKYPKLNDLLKISDILISDYSSIVFDYSILERPIFCYGYDYDTYLAERGTYINLNELFSQGVIYTEDKLLSVIKNINYHEECQYTKTAIKNKYIAAYGNAAEKAAQIIFEK